MRELKVVGLDPDGKYVLCEGANSAEKFRLPADDRLRAVLAGETIPAEQPALDIVVTNMLSPKDIQARIRAGASVEQVAAASGSEVSRIQRFANPVLLERFRAAELATAAHPIMPDGPSVLNLLETVTAVLMARGLSTDKLTWDAWRNEDSRWTVQLGWQAGRSDNIAHFRFTPGAHGGMVTAIDDAASELIDPEFKPRQLAPVAHLAFDAAPATAPSAPVAPSAPSAASTEPPASGRRGKPTIPAWEDVLLGVRSSGQR